MGQRGTTFDKFITSLFYYNKIEEKNADKMQGSIKFLILVGETKNAKGKKMKRFYSKSVFIF